MHDDQVYNDDQGEYNARTQLERGDGGVHPMEKFPAVFGKSVYAQRFQALNGRTKEEHDKALWYEHMRTQPYLDARVHRSNSSLPSKKATFAAEEERISKIVDISIDDPNVLPRNISADEFVDLYSAVDFANHQRLALNVHLTISWELLGIKPKIKARDHSDFHDSILHPLRDWLRKRESPFAWIYSNEYSKTVGMHTHYLIHIRSDLLIAFKEYIFKRIKKINRLSTLNEKSFEIGADAGMDLFKQWRRFQYLCKGAAPFATLLHRNGIDKVYVNELIKFRYENPGNLHHIRRIGHSINLNRATRDGFNFKSLMEKGELDVAKLYPTGKVLSEPERHLEQTSLDGTQDSFLRFGTLSDSVVKSQNIADYF